MSILRVMLDLETTGISPGCCVLSIGACTFDLDKKFYAKIDHLDCSKYLKDNIDTIRWWNKQDQKAREEAFSGELLLMEALQQFSDWFANLPEMQKNIEVWGNGADFDVPILGAAYDVLDIKRPWAPFSARCHRTLKTLLPHIKAPERIGTKHNALDDAVNQAMHATNLLQML